MSFTQPTTRVPRPARRLWLMWAAVAWVVPVTSCVLGDLGLGCATDADCADGEACLAVWASIDECRIPCGSDEDCPDGRECNITVFEPASCRALSTEDDGE